MYECIEECISVLGSARCWQSMTDKIAFIDSRQINRDRIIYLSLLPGPSLHVCTNETVFIDQRSLARVTRKTKAWLEDKKPTR